MCGWKNGKITYPYKNNQRELPIEVDINLYNYTTFIFEMSQIKVYASLGSGKKDSGSEVLLIPIELANMPFDSNNCLFILKIASICILKAKKMWL